MVRIRVPRVRVKVRIGLPNVVAQIEEGYVWGICGMCGVVVNAE